jgi:predicted Rossmann fold nucleotide-binding protein DprA/Smf involved in DNA uptake
MNYLGNIDILQLHKTGFLCSRKCPAEIVLKSYEWAKEQREQGKCIVCGNHSQIEKDVFEILLKGKQPLILVLARGMKKRFEPSIQRALHQKRLLIISPFSDNEKRVTRELAEKRNQEIIKICNYVIVGYKTKDGQLDKLLNEKQYENI